jgi:hypothetical protein
MGGGKLDKPMILHESKSDRREEGLQKKRDGWQVVIAISSIIGAVVIAGGVVLYAGEVWSCPKRVGAVESKLENHEKRLTKQEQVQQDLLQTTHQMLQIMLESYRRTSAQVMPPATSVGTNVLSEFE